jgi:peptidoglycan biosynthesis protein MviN/MurJ (putative lipid II flippase)
VKLKLKVYLVELLALLLLASCSPAVKVARHYRHFAKSAPRQSQRPLRLAVALGLCLLVLASCTSRVYWPQNHSQRPTRTPRRVAQITVLEEGRDYQGWSPALTKCQQKPFPFHSLTKK